MNSLHENQQALSSSQFHEWKQHPVTERLFTEFLAALLDQLDSELPANTNEALPVAFIRQGAKEMLYELWTWEPQGMIEDNRSEELSKRVSKKGVI